MSVEAGAEPLPGLYLHIPFCSAICPYCDFAVRRGGGARGGPFVDQLLEEVAGLTSGTLLPEAPDLAEAVTQLAAGPFDTVYLGGGTPSVLLPEDLDRLLEGLRRHFRLSPDTRLFLEANPEDVCRERLRAWRRAGVATLSLGVQSLDDDALRFLGRGHRAAQAVESVHQAREEGFATVSVDLIYGLPGQERTAWEVQLEQALDLGIDHLSLYELESHPRTHFGRLQQRGRLSSLPEGQRAELFLTTH
ncbi:MAG: radical SAM protein, partial [Holophagales bacterium]|nr:radical SAM protein [Holophagales bacterium]